MKKASNREICIIPSVYSSLSNLKQLGRRSLTPGVITSKQDSIAKISKEIIKAGITLINTEKKHSILTVPKTPKKLFMTYIENNKEPYKKIDINDSFSTVTTTNSTRTVLSNNNRGLAQFTEKFSRVRSGYRFRKNPNQENLKEALIEITKNPPVTTGSVKIKENIVEIKNEKSDIEKLLESQGKSYLQKKLKKSIQEINLSRIQDVVQDPHDKISTKSQRSDPSPVRDKPSTMFCDLSQTPRKRKLLRVRSTKLKFLKSSKAGKEFMDKYQNQKKAFKLIENIPSSASLVTHSKGLYDYRQESLKILKDTSFFANKIMKGIRCPGRIKKCYY